VSLTRRSRPGIRAAALACGAGLVNGLLAALTKATAHLFDTQGIFGGFRSWIPYAVAVCAVLTLLLASSAFQAGPTSASLAGLFATEPVAGIAIGALLLHESLQIDGWAPLAEVAGIGLALTGVVLLAKSPLVLATHEASAPQGEDAAAPPAPEAPADDGPAGDGFRSRAPRAPSGPAREG